MTKSDELADFFHRELSSDGAKKKKVLVSRGHLLGKAVHFLQPRRMQLYITGKSHSLIDKVKVTVNPRCSLVGDPEGIQRGLRREQWAHVAVELR